MIKYEAKVLATGRVYPVATINWVKSGLNVGVLSCSHDDCIDCIAYYDFEQVDLTPILEEE